jgi:crossover junction endodeoxyribonuclease RuvC
VRVLGIDPGLTRCGIGVVDGTPGRPLELVHCQVVTTPASDPLGDRLCAVDDAVARLLEEFRPDAVAVERVFSQHNVRTVMGVAQVSGVAVVAATRAGAAVAWHTPSEVKAAVTGNGRADKEQVAAMVVRLLRLRETPRPVDVTDALALAVCHVWRGGAQRRIEAAVAQQRAGRRAPVDVTDAAVVRGGR